MVAQQTPLAVIADPPSVEIVAPENAEIAVIEIAPKVVIPPAGRIGVKVVVTTLLWLLPA